MSQYCYPRCVFLWGYALIIPEKFFKRLSLMDLQQPKQYILIPTACQDRLLPHGLHPCFCPGSGKGLGHSSQDHTSLPKETSRSLLQLVGVAEKTKHTLPKSHRGLDSLLTLYSQKPGHCARLSKGLRWVTEVTKSIGAVYANGY